MYGFPCQTKTLLIYEMLWFILYYVENNQEYKVINHVWCKNRVVRFNENITNKCDIN